jgi:hypothetical protein
MPEIKGNTKRNKDVNEGTRLFRVMKANGHRVTSRGMIMEF